MKISSEMPMHNRFGFVFSALMALLFLGLSHGSSANADEQLANCTIEQQSSFFQSADKFLKKYVNDKGHVDYVQVGKTGKSQLALLMSAVASFDKASASAPERKAFYINAYNLSVIDQIVKNPTINSPMDLPGFFDKVSRKVAGTNITLNHLENEILRKKHADPRLHFALVCGAMGCPPLRDGAFLPASLEKQLEETTTRALNLSTFIRASAGKVALSEIFKWYRVDFPKGDKGLIQFINRYRKSKLKPAVTLSFYTYDWKVNQA